MPLMTELLDRGGRARAIPWSWEDRCILVRFVYAEDGEENLRTTGKHTIANDLGYSQVDTRVTVRIRPGQAISVGLRMQDEFSGSFTVRAIDPSAQALLADLKLKTDYAV